MCGIAGSFGMAWNVAQALERIAHRGPDAVGMREDSSVVHGHVRLSVLDLSNASNQPFQYEGGTLTYNGELWNYRALRAELELEGCVFVTSGDTEVVAAALSRWGSAALARFDGMFALCWTKGALRILARDRFGKVPLYVLKRQGGYCWASERKAWGKGHGAFAAPLPAASWLDLSTGKVHRYYTLGSPEQDAETSLLALLRHGVRKRMIADAPLCVLCSGGLDSSLILALAREQRQDLVAYTAKHNSDASDLKAARRLCAELEVPLVEVQVEAPSARTLEQAVEAIELQSKAQTEIAVLCLPLAARIQADGFKVALSGEAADEIFGGYGNMAIAAAQPGADWRAIRIAQLEKMARGNFVRCNKAFMAHSVECRLPFMDRALVEQAIALDKESCPPGKGALKRAAASVLPAWVIARQKETFQGSSGMAAACARAVAAPTRFYNATARSAFGGAVEA